MGWLIFKKKDGQHQYWQERGETKTECLAGMSVRSYGHLKILSIPQMNIILYHNTAIPFPGIYARTRHMRGDLPKNQNYLLEGGPLMVQASPTRRVF